MNCNLCKAKEESSDLIIETQHSYCLLAKAPIKLGHVMILPRNHVNCLTKLSLVELEDFFLLRNKIIIILEKIGFENILTVLHSGPNQGSEEHLHIHLIPCKAGLRDLMSSFENTPYRKELSQEERFNMKKTILNNFKY